MVNFEDDFSQDTICEYMNYLINECNLNVSIHISEKYFILKCNSQLSGLLQYNRHISPYCVYVKKCNAAAEEMCNMSEYVCEKVSSSSILYRVMSCGGKGICAQDSCGS